eukprot:IDg15721t1
MLAILCECFYFARGASFTASVVLFETVFGTLYYDLVYVGIDFFDAFHCSARKQKSRSESCLSQTLHLLNKKPQQIQTAVNKFIEMHVVLFDGAVAFSEILVLYAVIVFVVVVDEQIVANMIVFDE